MIGIGISTYNDFAKVNNLLNSIKRHSHSEYRLIVIDDGTKDENTINALKKICEWHEATLKQNSENMGIPYTWNRLTELCAPNPEDIAILLNNDVLVTDDSWLSVMNYFLTQNENIGMVGYPLIYPKDNDRTNKEQSWNDTPGHVGAAVGCCFGFIRKLWDNVKNPDGSTGFWEDLISFHEETQFGFMLSRLGYYNYMLPWPPFVHYGGKTFENNVNLCERTVDWSKYDNLNKQEYIETINKSKVYPEEWKKEKIVWRSNYFECAVDRMAFSRYMFAKYWNVLDNYDAPQIPVHEKLVTPMPKRKVKWLDVKMREMEAIV